MSTAGDVIDGVLASKLINLFIALLVSGIVVGVLFSNPVFGPEMSILLSVLVVAVVSWGFGSAYGKRKVYRDVAGRK